MCINWAFEENICLHPPPILMSTPCLVHKHALNVPTGEIHTEVVVLSLWFTGQISLFNRFHLVCG